MDNTFKLIWKSEQGESYNVGELGFKSGKYYFRYNEANVKNAKSVGFELLSSFPKVNAKYFREELFKTFQDWIKEKEQKEEKLMDTLKTIANDRFYFLEKEEVS
jgi:hypothetical protein